MQYTGILTGLIAVVVIGAFHPIVVWCEYYFSERVWPVFFVIGSTLIALSLAIDQVLLSSCLSIIGFVSLWCIGELKEQAERVRKGWFPANPKRRERRAAQKQKDL